MRKLVLAGIVGLGILGSHPSSACTCVPDDTRGAELVAKHDAVFIGEVVVMRLIEHAGPRTERGFAVWHEQEIKFRVWKAWKGVSDSFVTLRTGSGGGDCGFGFRPGYAYVVFASVEAGELQTNICTPTVEVSGQWELIRSMGPPTHVHEHNVGFEQF